MRGMVFGWVAPALVKLKEGEYDFAVTDTELSCVASAQPVGRFFGPLLTAVILDRVGRKFSLMIGCFSFLILCFVMIFVRSVTFIILVRMLMGSISGMFDVICFVYLAENCSPKVRGVMGGVTLLFNNVGALIGNILTAYASYWTASMANAIVCLCLTVTIFFAKESPYFLAMKGRDEEAKQNLLWLRGRSGSDKNTIVELDKIQENVLSEISKKKSLVTRLKDPETGRPVLMITICCFATLLSGGPAAITAYSSMIFQKSSNFSSKEFTILMVIFDLAGSFIFPLVVEKFNRRTLMQTFLLVFIICNALIFVLYPLELTIYKDLLPWTIFSTVTFLFMINGWASCTLGLMRGELLPMHVKGFGTSVGVMMTSLGAGLNTAIFWPISVTFGIQYNFLLFSILSVITLIYIFKALPETKGKTLVDIQLSLQSSLLGK